MRSFEAVTGPKQDRWLARTVGALLGLIAVVLGCALRSRRLTPEVRLLAAGSAAALAVADISAVLRVGVSRVYLLDAAFEVVFAIPVAATLLSRSHGSR